jgi:hypothetical protein
MNADILPSMSELNNLSSMTMSSASKGMKATSSWLLQIVALIQNL